MGHHHKYSTSFVNFFLVGIDSVSRSAFFKMREIFFGVFSFKQTARSVLLALESNRLDVVLTFSSFDQFSSVASMLKSVSMLDSTHKFNASFYSILKPQSGFLTSDKRLVAPEFIVGTLPEDIYYAKSVFLSFGQDMFSLLTKELTGRVGSLACGVMDSNQRRTWGNIDYAIPGNDDSVRVPFFLTSILLNAAIQASQRV